MSVIMLIELAPIPPNVSRWLFCYVDYFVMNPMVYLLFAVQVIHMMQYIIKRRVQTMSYKYGSKKYHEERMKNVRKSVSSVPQLGRFTQSDGNLSDFATSGSATPIAGNFELSQLAQSEQHQSNTNTAPNTQSSSATDSPVNAAPILDNILQQKQQILQTQTVDQVRQQQQQQQSPSKHKYQKTISRLRIIMSTRASVFGTIVCLIVWLIAMIVTEAIAASTSHIQCNDRFRTVASCFLIAYALFTLVAYVVSIAVDVCLFLRVRYRGKKWKQLYMLPVEYFIHEDPLRFRLEHVAIIMVNVFYFVLSIVVSPWTIPQDWVANNTWIFTLVLVFGYMLPNLLCVPGISILLAIIEQYRKSKRGEDGKMLLEQQLNNTLQLAMPRNLTLGSPQRSVGLQSKPIELPSEHSRSFTALHKNGINEENLREALKWDMFFQLFCAYAQKEFSVENLLFWREVKFFKNVTYGHARYMIAKRICNDFLRPHATMKINCTLALENEAIRIVDAAKPEDHLDDNIFDQIEAVVMGNIFDTYTRLVVSNSYSKFVEAHDNLTRSINDATAAVERGRPFDNKLSATVHKSLEQANKV